ncbi:hypothetical protein GGI07_004537 [Coemansia sp. Benny D115]|nr:hypothetical protein GGI07_004537 [Coemansia sp. Benny D115]
MGLLARATSVAGFAVFAWWMVRLVSVAIKLFYPTTNIPILNEQPPVRPGATVHRLAWQEPMEYHASVYVSTMSTFAFEPQQFIDTAQRIWHSGPNTLSQRYPKFARQQVQINLPESVRTENGTQLYAYLAVQRANGQKKPFIDFEDEFAVFAKAPLTSMRQRVVDRKHSLLKGQTDDQALLPEAQEGPWVPHGKTRLQWEIVLEDNRFYDWRIPLDLAPHLRVLKESEDLDRPYTPLAWENPLAAYAKYWIPLTNQSTISTSTPLDATVLSVDLALSGVTLGWFRLCNYADQGMRELASPRSFIKYSAADMDSLREMVYEVNPTMLGITMAAMALHMLFEFLAYKEDVSFWSNKSGESLSGISRSSMLMAFASAWISLWYMWDRRKETNIVVLFGAGAGALVELWKLTKVLALKDLVPFKSKTYTAASKQISKKAKAKAKAKSTTDSEAELRSKVQHEVDQQTAWYMTRVCLPLLVLYALFSLLYRRHDSYLSWFLHVSLTTVYSLEFIQMWPQLLINHKLQTVEMLPLTAFLYRFLLTFIDDLYALVVPMPLIERIGTLRDDAVFVVLCYQWLKFPKRQNQNPPQADSDKKNN